MRLRFLFLALFPFSALGQNVPKVIIEGKMDSSTLQNIRIYSYGIKNDLKVSHFDTVFRPIPCKPFKVSLRISQKGIYGIQDGVWSMFTHQIFLRPGDTIALYFYPRPHYEEQLKGPNSIFTKHIMIAKAKYPGNITYFDDIANKHPIKYGHIIDENLSEYKHQCESAYRTWLNLLNDFYREGKVSKDFIPYAHAELFSKFIMWLTDPASIIPRNKFPENYFSISDTLFLNNEDYMSSLPSYVNAALDYDTYILNEFDVHHEYGNLKKEFDVILRNYKGIGLDQMMGMKILDYIGKGNPFFDTAYSIFLSRCQNNNIKRFVKNKIREHNLTANINTTKANLPEVLKETELYSSKNELSTLKQVIGKKQLCLIDCWATWCAPCRVQMPYLKEIEKEFKDSVQFISISFNEERKPWDDFIFGNINRLPGEQYLLSNIDSSVFIRYFQVHSIPRYILLSKEGTKVLQSYMPQPILTNQFIKILQKYLQ